MKPYNPSYMNILLILILIVISFIYSVHYPSDTYGETISFYPLKLFLEEDPQILGYGGIRTYQKTEPDLWRSPAYLSRQKESSISTHFIRDDTWRVKTGDFNGSGLRSYAVGLDAHLPITKRQNQVIGLVIKSDWAKGKFQDENEDTGLSYEEDYTQFNISYGMDVLSWLTLGGSIGKEDRAAETQYGLEAVLSPVRGIDIGYREYQRNFDLKIFAQEDQQGLIPISQREKIREIFFNADLFKPVNLSLIKDLTHTNSYAVTAGYSLKKFHFSVAAEEQNLTHREYLSLDGNTAGENRGKIHYSAMTLGSGIHLNTTNDLYIAFRKTSYDGEGGGRLRPETVTTFWEEIIAGDRIYLYSLGLDAVQYMIGIESYRSNQLKLRGGLQYVSASPAASLNHWTPFPIIGIGKLDETMVSLNVRKIHFVIPTFGFSYTTDKWTLSYGIGQYIPIQMEKRTEDGEIVHEDVAQGGDFGDIIDAIKEYPGGNLQSLSIQYNF